VARYIAGRKLRGEKRYRCAQCWSRCSSANLACAGCGKGSTIRRRSCKDDERGDALRAVTNAERPCIPSPEAKPLIHRDLAQIRRRQRCAAQRFVLTLCTKMRFCWRSTVDEYRPSPLPDILHHMDGNRCAP